jgi:hypothetical protein
LNKYTPLLACWKRNERSRNQLDLLVLKPDRFFDLGPFYSNQVKAKRLLKARRKRMDAADGSSQFSKGAVTYKPYPAANGKDLHPMLS